jgi:hypothetical protein
MTAGLKTRRAIFFNGCTAHFAAMSMARLLNDMRASCGRALLGTMPIAQIPAPRSVLVSSF